MIHPTRHHNNPIAGSRTKPDMLPARIRREQRTIATMLRIYCGTHHGTRSGLCGDCEELRAYADQRLRACPFQVDKPACNHCEVHCYSAHMRERVRAMMRYAGPRMLLRHPLFAVLHLLDERRPLPRLPQRKATARHLKDL
jgi:hypothetical protein